MTVFGAFLVPAINNYRFLRKIPTIQALSQSSDPHSSDAHKLRENKPASQLYFILLRPKENSLRDGFYFLPFPFLLPFDQSGLSGNIQPSELPDSKDRKITAEIKANFSVWKIPL